MARRTAAQRRRHLAELRRLVTEGWSQRRLAAHFQVSKATIQRDVRALAASPPATPPAATPGVSLARRPRLVHRRGRLTQDRLHSRRGSFRTILPPPDFESSWRNLDFDRATLDKVSPALLLEILLSLSPDISRATWDFLRMFDAGHEIRAYVPGSDDVEDETAQAALDAFLDRLDARHGSRSVVWARLAMGAWVRGAFFAEIVLDPAGREPLDLVTPDPFSARFREVDDPDLGLTYELGQWQGGQFMVLDRPTIVYIPVDPFPGSPYGRSPIAAALFPALFLLGLFHDLRRVVAQQGYPRIDLSVVTERIKAMFVEIESDEAFADLVNDLTDEIITAYEELEPDDAYVHPDWITVQRSVGAVDASSIGAADALIKALERLAVRALKTMPLMMGTTEGVSEANANRQWEMYVAGIKSLQHLAESLLEQVLGVALEAQGILAEVRVRFSEVRSAEELRDQQTLQMKIANAKEIEATGWGTRDEASEHALGHPAKEGAPAPLAPVVADDNDNEPPPADEVVAEPGSNRWLVDEVRALLSEIASRQAEAASGEEPVAPAGADVPLGPLPDKVTVNAVDVAAALGVFDVAAPDYAGLLDAAVLEDEETAAD